MNADRKEQRDVADFNRALRDRQARLRRKPRTLVLAIFETPNFRFTALGANAKEAWQAIELGWAKHCAQTGADLSYLDRSGVQFDTMTVGDAFRDGSEIR